VFPAPTLSLHLKPSLFKIYYTTEHNIGPCFTTQVVLDFLWKGGGEGGIEHYICRHMGKTASGVTKRLGSNQTGFLFTYEHLQKAIFSRSAQFKNSI